MVERLPFDTLASLVDMLRLHTEGDKGLRWAARDGDGQAGEGQALAECLNCGKPSIAAFPIIKRHPATRLMAVRTAADVAWASYAVARIGQT